MTKTNVSELSTAIMEFEHNLPGWWWSVGNCSVSRDASCGPDRQGPDADLLEHRMFDEGFHHDDRDGDCALALREVMTQAMTERNNYR